MNRNHAIDTLKVPFQRVIYKFILLQLNIIFPIIIKYNFYN